jgi:hypothetical protein
MSGIHELQKNGIVQLQQAMQVAPVALKYPFPVRPARMLGLIKFDGQVYNSEKLTRAVFMQISLPVFMKVYSTFISPKIEYDLPVFTCETILMGKKRVFVVDAHASGAGGENQHTSFFDRLMEIRNRYPELTRLHKTSKDGIASLQSKAAVRVTMPRALDEQAAGIFSEYFSAYLDLVNSAEPVTGLARAKLQAAFDTYLKTVVDHDPGVKGNIMFFGKKEGLERALDMFYGV